MRDFADGSFLDRADGRLRERWLRQLGELGWLGG
jgi:hypothetical protein